MTLGRPDEGGHENPAAPSAAVAASANGSFTGSPFAEARFTADDFALPHPESLRSPAFLLVRHDQIVGDPYNIRDRLPGIVRLARSIHRWGLLENLVVVEIPPERRKGPELYELKAGSCRFEAMRRLIHEGVEPLADSTEGKAGVLLTWPPDQPIPVRVLGSDGHFEHLVENIERNAPHPWELGRRLNEILSAGVTSRELGGSINRSNGWVTRYAFIGRNLSPEVIELIVRERAELHLSQLAAIATHRNQFGEPDGPAQVAFYQSRRGRKRRRAQRRDPQSFRAMMKRMQYLRAEMPVPSFIRPVVSAIVTYLEEGARPNFQTLETHLFEKVRAYSPHIDSEDT